MESFETRLRRFVENPPGEIFGTLLNSIANYLLPQLRAILPRLEANVDLFFLGSHAIAQTVSEKLLGERGAKGTFAYLE